MGTTLALIIFGVSLAAGAVIDCDKRQGSTADTGLQNSIGEYVNIAINEHHSPLDLSGITPQGVSLPNGQFTNHGTNLFFKPHIVLSSGYAPMEQPSIPQFSGNHKLDDSLAFIPQYSPEMTLISGAIPQSLPEQPISVSVPEPAYIQPVIQEPIENINEKLPLVIPPAPELPPMQLPTLPVPVVFGETPLDEQLPMVQPISQTVLEPIFEPLPQSPVIQPVYQEPIETVNEKLPLIPAAPELPPLQLPILPVPVNVEENLANEQVSSVQIAESTEAPIVAAVQDETEYLSNATPEENKFVMIPEAPVLPALALPVDVVNEETKKPFMNNFGVSELGVASIIAIPEMNQQPIFIGERQEYPIMSSPFLVGAQKELVVQPCPPQTLQSPGLIQIHQYINSVPQAAQTLPFGSSIIYEK